MCAGCDCNNLVASCNQQNIYIRKDDCMKKNILPSYYLIYKRIKPGDTPIENFKGAYVDGNFNIYYEIGNKIFRTTSHFAGEEISLRDRVTNIISREVS